MEYYRVRKKDAPEENGIVVKVNKREISNMTGGIESLSEYGCSISEKGVFCVGENFYLEQISKSNALELEEDYFHWRIMQDVVAEQDPVAKRSAVPGDSRI